MNYNQVNPPGIKAATKQFCTFKVCDIIAGTDKHYVKSTDIRSMYMYYELCYRHSCYVETAADGDSQLVPRLSPYELKGKPGNEAKTSL